MWSFNELEDDHPGNIKHAQFLFWLTLQAYRTLHASARPTYTHSWLVTSNCTSTHRSGLFHSVLVQVTQIRHIGSLFIYCHTTNELPREVSSELLYCAKYQCTIAIHGNWSSTKTKLSWCEGWWWSYRILIQLWLLSLTDVLVQISVVWKLNLNWNWMSHLDDWSNIMSSVEHSNSSLRHMSEIWLRH